MASNLYTLNFSAPYLGLAQSSYKDDNNAIGNNNVFSRIHNCSLYNQNGISNSPLMEDRAVGELLHNITDYCVKTDLAYGISNNKIYSIAKDKTITEVHTITGGNNKYGNSLALIGDYLYYFYNTTNGYNIGRYDLNNTWEDTFSATTISGSPITTNISSGINSKLPNKIISVGGDMVSSANYCYFANGYKLGYILSNQNKIETSYLTFPKQEEISDITSFNGYLLVATSNVISYKGDSCIYFISTIPETTTQSAVKGYIHVNGKIGCLFSDNGTLYVIYSTEDSVVRIAYLNGSTLVDITSFEGSLPNCFQKTKVMDFLMFKSCPNIVAIGNSAVGLGISTYNYENCYDDNGCIAAPFNSLIISGERQVNYAVSFITNDYNSDSYIETLTINADKIDNISTLNSVLINTNPLLNGEELEVDFYVDGVYHKTVKVNNPSGRQEIGAPNNIKTLKLVIKWKTNKQVIIKNISFKFNTNEFSNE